MASMAARTASNSGRDAAKGAKKASSPRGSALTSGNPGWRARSPEAHGAAHFAAHYAANRYALRIAAMI